MNNKILLRIFFLLAFSIHSSASIDDYIYPYSSPSYNEYGSLGLIRMPSARFHEEGTIAFHWSKNEFLLIKIPVLFESVRKPLELF